jgi:hypothetical protein
MLGGVHGLQAIAWSGTELERGFLKRCGLRDAAEAAMLQEQNKRELKKQRSRQASGKTMHSRPGGVGC